MSQLQFRFPDAEQRQLFCTETAHKDKLKHVSVGYHQKKLHHKNKTRKQLTAVFAKTETYNKKRNKGFKMKLKKKRPLWQEGLIFAVTALTVWSGSHVWMNSGAFTQIANFKVQMLTASVVEAFTPEPEEDVRPQKVEKVATPFRNKKIKPRNAARDTFKKMTVYPSDNRIILPRIGKNVPLVKVPSHQNWNELEGRIQKGLQNGVVVHPVSRAPGAFGNFFVTGHSSYYEWDEGRYKDVFALLHELKENDKIEVYWEGKKYVYKMYHTEVIPPTKTSILEQPDDRSIMTLMTCTPIGTNTNRLIWQGELVSVE